MRLEPLALWFQPQAGRLLPQLRAFLLAAGQARAGTRVRLLRWAITAAEPARGLRIEAVLVVGELDDGEPSGEVNPGSEALPGSGLTSEACLGSGSGSDSGSASMTGSNAVMTAGQDWDLAAKPRLGLVSGFDSAPAATVPASWRC